VAASPLGALLFPAERRRGGLSILGSAARAPGDGLRQTSVRPRGGLPGVCPATADGAERRL